VQSLRNYRLVCPSGGLFRSGHVCQDCVGRRVPWPGVVHACYRGSRSATAAVAAMITVHDRLQTWRRMVDLYIAVSRFARDKLIEGGLPADRIVVKPNFVERAPALGTGDGGYALFVGRLSPEKGLSTVLDTWQRLRPAIPLKIVGDGPLAETVATAAERQLGVDYLGRRPLAEVYEIMRDASFMVLPSEWYEPFGRVVVEAFSCGTPVIASDTGGMAELVDDGRTGRLFRTGDAQDLAEAVEWALEHPAELAWMRGQARAEFEAHYTAERNYQQLMAIYGQALRRRWPSEPLEPAAVTSPGRT